MSRKHPTPEEQDAATMSDGALRSLARRLPAAIASDQRALAAVRRELKRRKRAARLAAEPTQEPNA